MIKVENLYYEYEDGTKALNNINMDMSKGKVIGIIGANGSGKSTLFLNIMGILRPSKGFVKYNDIPIKYSKSYLREYRKQVNIVFQNPEHQIFYSNVFDDIAFSLRNIGISEDIIKEKVVHALDEVNGLDLANKPVHFLSYGQKKRVAIAGVLVMNSRVLLLDEPTAGLDPYMSKQMKGIINEISKDKNIIISSHDMDLIYDICDYIYILRKGSIIGEGIPQEIFLKDNLVDEAYLVKPWLIRIHEKFGTPLFKNEEDFIAYNGKENL
ncbi:ATP-binding cassette domain-containing protein [Tissierella sp.]|uniref:energy-coupling factor ABC transporter ATP-binding protein n=1 Tax=Tissierella sp. TaxID=41274 RepID=UPI0028B0A7CB|nr:ATP-binding cassette domain-containing protein [Tissierella sp.]